MKAQTKSKTSRCITCRKKTLIGINCRCGNYFCLKHRLPEDHKCTELKLKMDEEKAIFSNILLEAAIIDNKVEKI